MIPPRPGSHSGIIKREMDREAQKKRLDIVVSLLSGLLSNPALSIKPDPVLLTELAIKYADIIILKTK